MAKNRPKYLSPGSTQIGELRELVDRGPGFFHIGANEIPSIVPEGLRQKCDSAVVVVAPTADAMAIILHRIDQNAGQMDRDPFLIGVSASNPHGIGVLLHHADFNGRSESLPSSSMGLDYFKKNPSFGLSSGSTSELPTPLVQAFSLAHRALKSTSST